MKFFRDKEQVLEIEVRGNLAGTSTGKTVYRANVSESYMGYGHAQNPKKMLHQAFLSVHRENLIDVVDNADVFHFEVLEACLNYSASDFKNGLKATITGEVVVQGAVVFDVTLSFYPFILVSRIGDAFVPLDANRIDKLEESLLLEPKSQRRSTIRNFWFEQIVNEPAKAVYFTESGLKQVLKEQAVTLYLSLLAGVELDIIMANGNRPHFIDLLKDGVIDADAIKTGSPLMRDVIVDMKLQLAEKLRIPRVYIDTLLNDELVLVISNDEIWIEKTSSNLDFFIFIDDYYDRYTYNVLSSIGELRSGSTRPCDYAVRLRRGLDNNPAFVRERLVLTKKGHYALFFNFNNITLSTN